ncbi:hypothetical protein ACQUY5_16565 [Bacillus cereus]|uniref:hypothetical protein n=1 Tax=Bacillus cereus TaxID=1396 RepID=UPI003D17A7AD
MEIEIKYKQIDLEFKFYVATITDNGKVVFKTNNLDMFKNLLGFGTIKLGSPIRASLDGDIVLNYFQVDKSFEFRPFTTIQEVSGLWNVCYISLNKEVVGGYMYGEDDKVIVYHPSFDLGEENLKSLYVRQREMFKGEKYPPLFVLDKLQEKE